MSLTVLCQSDQYIHCEVQPKDGSALFLVTMVYGANSMLERRALWHSLSQFRSSSPWVVLGDFNAIRYPRGKLRGMLSGLLPWMTLIAVCLILNLMTLDHSPTVVYVQPNPRKSIKPFKFFDFLADHPQFLELSRGLGGQLIYQVLLLSSLVAITAATRLFAAIKERQLKFPSGEGGHCATSEAAADCYCNGSCK
ncbi:hypothetical protein RHMOL_Rhmol03G0148200 [Rhododendron molle]|uniref:Uncharacterized protein n=1 Tax=Rhododendron molle TaxID=49168 RepID=A0ACC0PE67_RHOML|nr:hypothetical protein RHMOL_Rhmol03G0148200 [Rhododendron molle]